MSKRKDGLKITKLMRCAEGILQRQTCRLMKRAYKGALRLEQAGEIGNASLSKIKKSEIQFASTPFFSLFEFLAREL